ncbi:MAG: hypothetical protein RQ751_13150 [Longimicrobiales bacterium]|nr:hypothetical protein [Longimicrobiales bacterium]
MSPTPARRSATRGPTRWVIGFFLALIGLYATLGARAWLRNQRTLEAIEALRLEVHEARTAADSCTADLALAESDLRGTDAAADSLRGAVERAEDTLPGGGRGVPAAEYEAYLEAFERYNDTVREWEARARELREHEERCRALIERHNALTDSLRGRLNDAGITLG